MKKVCAWLIPHQLSDEQNRQKVTYLLKKWLTYLTEPAVVDSQTLFSWCLISDRTGIGCQPIRGDILFWSQVSPHRNKCLQCFLIVKAHLLYKCFKRASTSIVNTPAARFCPKWFNTCWKLGLPPSEQQAGCICSITMLNHIILRKWETTWPSTRSRFCLTLPTALTLSAVIFCYFLCWWSAWLEGSSLGART